MNQLFKSKTILRSSRGSQSTSIPARATACEVIVVDDDFHREPLERIIAQCGATPTWLRNVNEVEIAGATSRASILLIALSDELTPNAPLLDTIHALKGAGFYILAFAGGVKNWPIRTRCLPLVAGATNLLDSSSSDFESELARLLTQFVQAEAQREEEERQVKETMAKAGLIGESPAMLTLFRTILRISVLSDLPVLLTGETGTGKELLAHAIHASDPKRYAGPFVAVNCGAISPGLAESELFGHRRGAFTGADRERKGLIRSAHGGILFLDEVGELDDTLQSKLLRMLQERTVLGVGEDSETAVDVRIVAATNRHLDEMVAEKKFREDLFYRLNVLSVHTPPLRERPADIEPLVNYFLQKYCALGPAVPVSVHGDFLEALMEVGLPGNVRQLENIVRQTLVNKRNHTPLTLADLPAEILQQLSKRPDRWQGQSQSLGKWDEEGGLASPPQRGLPSSVVKLFDANNWRLTRSLASCEKLLLEEALRKTRGNQSQTARLLGITSRTVYNKVRKYHLTSQ